MCDTIEVETNDNLQYVFFHVSSCGVRLRVKAVNDAHIALTSGACESDPMTEIHIGGWDNTKSIVRRNRREPDKVKVATPNILNRDEYVSMWVSWYNNRISAGLEGQTPFISYDDPAPHPINFMAVRTGWGSCGSWKIEVSPIIIMPRAIDIKPISGGRVRWVRMSTGDVLPSDAVIGGFEDERVYVARARHSGSLCAGKYVPSLRRAVVPYQHSAHMKEQFEVLCGHDCMWMKTERDLIPPHAIPGGIATEQNNEVTYIGRAYVNKHLVPGKVHLHYKTCYLPYGNVEKEVKKYEVLVAPNKMPRQLIWIQP